MAESLQAPQPQEDPAREAQSARFGSPTGLALTALAALTLLFYTRLWLPDYVLIRRDAFRCFPALKQYVAERLRQGELPQWFPYEALGREFIGQAAGGVFHFFSLLYLLLPAHEAYRLSVLLSCLAAALGAYALGRLLGYSRTGSLVAGLAFTCSGYLVSLTENIQYLYPLCLLPLFCAALERGMRGHHISLVAATLLWTSVFLHGDMQTGYYYGFVALAWTVWRAPGPKRGAFLRLVAAIVLTALLSAVQLLPSAAVFMGSDRGDTRGFEEQALHWSLHPLRLVGLVASPLFEEPDEVEVSHRFFGGVVPGGFLPAGIWAQSVYLGLPVLGLALLGAMRRDLRVLTVIGAAALLLALGKYAGLYQVLYHALPFWSAFRYPEKFMGFVSFASAMLAGAGIDRLRTNPRGAGECDGESARPGVRGAGGCNSGRGWLLAAGIAAGASACLATDTVTGLIASFSGAHPNLAQRTAHLAMLGFISSSAAALGCGAVILAAGTGRLHASTMAWLLAALVILDLWHANFLAYTTGPAEMARFTPGLVGALHRHAGVAEPGHYRIFTIDETEFLSKERLDPHLSGSGITSLMSKEFLDVELNAPYHLESFNWYLPGNSSAMLALYQQAWDLRALGRYNVHYLIGRSEHFRDDPAFARALVAAVKDFDLALVHNPTLVKPRAYLSIHPEAAASPVDPMALQQRMDYLAGLVDVIEPDGTPLPSGFSGGKARIVSYAQERVEVGVEQPKPGVLVLLDAYADGWTARLDDGTNLSILRANGLVRAVVVPEGRHLVTFTYRTPYLTAGILLSLLGILACGLFLARTFGNGGRTE